MAFLSRSFLLIVLILAGLLMNATARPVIAFALSQKCYCPHHQASALCSLSDIKAVTWKYSEMSYYVTVINECAYCSAAWVAIESSFPGYPIPIKGYWDSTLKPKEVYTTPRIFGNSSLPHYPTQVNYTCVV